MAMSRVEWTRRTPEEIEEVLGILICSSYPLSATRVRPSRGDKGVDVYLRTPGGWVVFQIKGFTTSLTSSQERQIKESWASFTRFIEDDDLIIEAYHVVRPINPTWEDEEKLKRITDGAPFPCAWRGRDFCEALVAEFPKVVDYYLFGGRERLDETIARYLAIQGFQQLGAEGRTFALEPADAQTALTSVHEALNEFDPFFRYDFAVRAVTADFQPPDLGASFPPGIVASVTSSDGRTAVTFDIFERVKDAVLERPVPGRFTVAVDPSTPEGEAWSDFIKFGLPVERLPLTSMSLDLPGGLGVSNASGAWATIGPAKVQQVDLPGLTLISREGTELARVEVRTEPVTHGIDGTGPALRGTETGGAFDLVFKAELGGPSHYAFSLNSLTGSIPGALVPGLTFLQTCAPPNLFEARIAYGLQLAPAQPIPEAVSDADELRRILIVCYALADIQRHTAIQIRLPDLCEVTGDEASTWVRAARLLRGDVLTTRWNDMWVTLEPDATLPETGTEMSLLVVTVPLVVQVGGVMVDLGLQKQTFATVRIDPESSTHSGAFRLLPGTDDTTTAEWFPGEAEAAVGAP